MRDGHVHSKYCPHGTKDTFEQYLECFKDWFKGNNFYRAPSFTYKL